MNSKSQTVQIDRNTLKPVAQDLIDVYPGTESGNFYNEFAKVGGIIVTYRKLSERVSLDEPENGPEYRIRLIPTELVSKRQDDFLQILGFTPKGAANGIHYSRLTKTAELCLTAVVSGLDLIS